MLHGCKAATYAMPAFSKPSNTTVSIAHCSLLTLLSWGGVVQNAVVFQCYGAAARYLTGDQQQAPLSLSQVFCAGCFAGAVQTVGVELC